jgi:hypothetical protein
MPGRWIRYNEGSRVAYYRQSSSPHLYVAVENHFRVWDGRYWAKTPRPYYWLYLRRSADDRLLASRKYVPRQAATTHLRPAVVGRLVREMLKKYREENQ